MPVPVEKLPSPGNSISFSQINTEFRGASNANSQISMSELGYGGNILRSNNCTEQIRTNSDSPYYPNIGLLQVYTGPGSNMNVGNFRSKYIYAAPPIEASVLTGNNDQYNFNSFYSNGRNYNPNTDKKNTNVMFIDIRNSGTCYSSLTNNASSYSATIPNEADKGGTLVYFDNDGNIYGSGGAGGNAASGLNADNGSPGGPGGNGLNSQCERLYINNNGYIYGGGGGGAGGNSTKTTYFQSPGAGPTNIGSGGGGGGGGQGYNGGPRGNGGGPGANNISGGQGSNGGDGTVNGPGSGGNGGGTACGPGGISQGFQNVCINGPSVGGGAGGSWGNVGESRNGISGGPGGASIVITSPTFAGPAITYVNGDTGYLGSKPTATPFI